MVAFPIGSNIFSHRVPRLRQAYVRLLVLQEGGAWGEEGEEEEEEKKEAASAAAASSS